MQSQEKQPPQNLLQFLMLIIKSYITGIPSIIKGMIISVVISLVVANAIHFYLIGWVNDGWNPTGDPVLDALIFTSNHPTGPRVMLFYFLISYLFWWLIGMLRTRGIPKTIKLIATTPIWIVKNLTKAGLGALPMLLGGIAISFLIGLTALTGPTSIMMFLSVITILVSQEESLMVVALQLGFKDVKGLLNKGEAQNVPSPAQPVSALIGAGLGFGYMTFFKTNSTIIGGFAVLAIAALVFMYMRGRRNKTAATLAVLLIVMVVAQFATNVLADDGGIPENGGWSAVQPGGWLWNALVETGYPASIAAAIGAAIISGLFSPPVLSNVKPLTGDDHYVDKQYTDATPDDGKITTWRYIPDPTGTFVDSAGNKYRREETRGLPESIINAEDSDLLGPRVRIFTMDPPADQGLKDDIRDTIMDVDRTHLDRLHPDNWKNLTQAQKAETLTELSKALRESMGVDYDFEVYNDANKGLGGSYRRAYTTTNADGSTTEHRALLRINSNGSAMDDPRAALRTLIHENRHAYQKKVGDPNGTDYQKVVDYNNNNIQSSKVDYVRYGESLNERDSRSFGQDTTNQIIGDLNRIWGH